LSRTANRQYHYRSIGSQIAGHYLKQAVESATTMAAKCTTMSVEEVLEHLDTVLKEAGHTSKLPALVPVDDGPLLA